MFQILPTFSPLKRHDLSETTSSGKPLKHSASVAIFEVLFILHKPQVRSLSWHFQRTKRKFWQPISRTSENSQIVLFLFPNSGDVRPGTWPADPLTDALSQGEVVKDYVRPAGLVSNVSVSLKGRDALVTNQMTVGPWWISLSASFEETTMYIHSTYLSTFIFLT